MLPGIIFAVIVFLFALGNGWVGLYPYGAAVWVRPLVAMLGCAGAVLLLVGHGWWRVLLLVWCALQVFIVAIDVSGEWFYQGLFAGYRNTTAVKANEVMVQYEATGMNFAGLILLVLLLVLMAAKLHPPVKRPITRRSGYVAAALLLAFIMAIAGVWSLRAWRASDALVVIETDLPHVPIYYEGKLLGTTPLAISPTDVRKWGLPLQQPEGLKAYSWGWGDAHILTDNVTHLPLYAGVPWPFESYLDTFDTPWGQRCRMALQEGNGRRHSGYLYRRADLRDEPILTIQLLNRAAVQAGDKLLLRCTLTNPTSRTYTGRKTEIRRLCFGFSRRNPGLGTPLPGRTAELPQTWNTVAPGANLSADLEFVAPADAGAYELFCTWGLLAPGDGITLSGSCYSNMLLLNVAGNAATQTVSPASAPAAP